MFPTITLEYVSDNNTVEAPTPWWHWATLVLAIVSVAVAAISAALDHPHRAVLVISGTLIVLAVARLAIPGRPWFASRNRLLDASVYTALSLLIWYFADYTATMGLT